MEITIEPHSITLIGTKPQVNKLPKTILGDLDLIYTRVNIETIENLSLPVIIKSATYFKSKLSKEIEEIYLLIGNINIVINLEHKTTKLYFNTLDTTSLIAITYERAEQLLIKAGIL